jgi:heteromeric Ino2p/Ino4p transcription factor
MSRSDQAQASSTSNSPSSQAQLNQALRLREVDKPRLTDDQKKSNHITSEQNRRNFLRSQFDRLAEAVPGAKGKARSEALVLERLVDYGHAQLVEGRTMIERIESGGGVVDEKLKAKYYRGADMNAHGENIAGHAIDPEQGDSAYDTRSRSFG